MILFVQNRHTDQWDKMEDPNISTYNYGHLIFNKESKKKVPWRKETTSSKNGAGKTKCPHAEELN